jgi:anti-anti-sigma regulatory factor
MALLLLNHPCEMLKIRRSGEKDLAIFALSGRIEKEHVSELRELLQGETKVVEITLDLEEVRLVDREAVKFLADCEARGIRLRNCPSYVRQWMETGGRSHEPSF